MAKFARIIEDEKGEQLLLQVKPSEDHNGMADLVYTFQIDEGSITSLTMGGLDYTAAELALAEYPEEKGLNILANPLDFFNKLTE